jgi:uncharacterized protein (TIGR02118 family)
VKPHGCPEQLKEIRAMIKVSVMHPNEPGAQFDHEYYRTKHMPLVKERLGEACRHYGIDKGIAAASPGSYAPFVSICHIYCDSAEAFWRALDRHVEEISSDIKNYTTIAPITQISEVIEPEHRPT